MICNHLPQDVPADAPVCPRRAPTIAHYARLLPACLPSPPPQAQQRYRAKRKAQFEELQRRVHQLTAEATQHQVGHARGPNAQPGVLEAACLGLVDQLS